MLRPSSAAGQPYIPAMRMSIARNDLTTEQLHVVLSVSSLRTRLRKRLGNSGSARKVGQAAFTPVSTLSL